jgi:ATP synthase protein I
LEEDIRNSIGAPPLGRLIVTQGLVVVTVTLIGWVHSPISAYSALLGGLICWIPNSYFALKAFQHQGARAAKKIISTMYKAEAVKLVLTALLFFLVFYFVKPLNSPTLFIAFIGTQAVSWWSSKLLTHNPKRNH